MDHANWPAGPAGRFGHYNINLWAGFASSKNREGQQAFLRAWHDRSFLAKWTKAGQSYFIPPFEGHREARTSGRTIRSSRSSAS